MRSTAVLLAALVPVLVSFAGPPAGLPVPPAARSESPDDTAAVAEPGIVMTCIGAADAALCERVRAYVQESISCPVSLVPAPADVAALPREEQAAELAGLMRTGDIGVLACCVAPEDAEFEVGLFEAGRVAMVNLATVETIEKEGVPPEEQNARMIERACVQQAGLLLGLKNCPWPRCAMHVVPKETPHSIRGRNLCPPCHARACELLRERGIVPIMERPIEKPAD
jgi:hypothetical protein